MGLGLGSGLVSRLGLGLFHHVCCRFRLREREREEEGSGKRVTIGVKIGARVRFEDEG